MILLYIFDAFLLLLFVVLLTLAYCLLRRRGDSPPPTGYGLKNAEAEYLTRSNPVNWW